MRGTVLAYDRDSDTGLIRGEDGNRYGFRLREWRERSVPIKGVHVDFEPDGPIACGLYVIIPNDSAGDGKPVAIRNWIANHPEALVACMILIACGLPFYRFLGIETTLYQVPEIILRLSSGLERTRALAQQVPSAATAAAMIKMLLPGIYILWLIPLLAACVLYRVLFDLPRLGLLRLFGLSSVLLPVLVPLMVVVPTWFLVVQSIPAEQQVTLSHSVFDLPRFGPLREIALGSVATMILGLGLFLWSINPDNVDDRAAARQGTTNRHGRGHGQARPYLAEHGDRAGQEAPRLPGPGRSSENGAPDAFAPPRLRTHPEYLPSPQQGPQQAYPQDPARYAGPNPAIAALDGPAQTGAPTPRGHSGQASNTPPPSPMMSPDPAQMLSADGFPANPPAQGMPVQTQAASSAVPHHPHALNGGAQPPPSFDDGVPHHDPIPESLRRRFEERQQRMNQQHGGAGPAMSADGQRHKDTARYQPDAPATPHAQHGPAALTAPSKPASAPQLPDIRDGQGGAVDASVSGWSVDPGTPRHDFENMRWTGTAPTGQNGPVEEPYAALAQQLRLVPGGNVSATQSPPPGIASSNAGAPASPSDNSTAEDAKVQAVAQDSRADEKKESLPPPPRGITDFPRLLDEPDGLHKLATAAPPVPGFPASAPPAARSDTKPGSGAMSAASSVSAGPPAKPQSDKAAAPENTDGENTEKKPSRGNGIAPPPPPPPPDSALGRAMERLSGPPGSARNTQASQAGGEGTDSPESGSPKASGTVIAFYERPRQERSAREPKSDPPIPPAPPRR